MSRAIEWRFVDTFAVSTEWSINRFPIWKVHNLLFVVGVFLDFPSRFFKSVFFWKFITEKSTTGQRTKIIEFYFRNECSIIRTQRAYTCYFNDKTDKTSDTSFGAAFPSTGFCRWPRSVRMEENIERSQESVHEEPGTSIRRRSR